MVTPSFLAGEESDFRSAGVWHLAEETADLEGFRSVTEEGSLDREEALPARVLRTGSAEWVEDVKNDPAFPRLDASDPSPVRSAVSVPILSDERPVGVLEFYSVEERDRDPEMEALLEQIGVQLGYARHELIGESTEKLHLDRDSFESFGREGEEALRRHGTFHGQFPMRRKDGTIFAAEQTVTLLDPEKGLEGGW